MKDKRLHKFIAITLCVTLLTISASRVTRVSAVGTTIAASAAAALCAVGIVYCSYMALSGASVNIPPSDDVVDWLKDMGTKVVQFPSGRAAYEELYPELIGIGDEPLTSMLDRAWTWTTDKLKSWANDFSSTDVIENIATFEYTRDVSDIPLNGFNYTMTLENVPEVIMNYNGTFSTFAQYISEGKTFVVPPSAKAIIEVQGHYVYTDAWYDGATDLRNYFDGTYYGLQQYINGSWSRKYTFQYGLDIQISGEHNSYAIPLNPNYYARDTSRYTYYIGNLTYPILPDSVIYDATTDTVSELVIPDTQVVVRNPQYPTLPPDDDNKPVIPYLKLPFDPNWIDPITNLPTGGGNWGLNLRDLLDVLEDLSGTLMEIGAIGELINQFKNLLSGQDGDEYYIYYDDSEHDETFYQYYTITNYNGDVYQYDIDVSDADEHLPVDLNTIQSYTNNRYLDEVKRSAIAGSSIIRDLVVFWYDVNPMIVYIFFGSCIAIIVAAFIGKWGHS